MALSTALLIIIGWVRPFESRYLNRLELFSEYVTTCTLYTVMLFTDFVQKAEGRHFCGYIFITIVMLFALVHIGLITLSSLARVRERVHRRYLRHKHKKAMLKYQ